jgi:hypothetical protein
LLTDAEGKTGDEDGPYLLGWNDDKTGGETDDRLDVYNPVEGTNIFEYHVVHGVVRGENQGIFSYTTHQLKMV